MSANCAIAVNHAEGFSPKFFFGEDCDQMCPAPCDHVIGNESRLDAALTANAGNGIRLYTIGPAGDGGCAAGEFDVPEHNLQRTLYKGVKADGYHFGNNE